MQTQMKEGRRTYKGRHLVFSALGGALVMLLALALVLWLILGPYALSILGAWGAVRLRFVGEYDPAAATDAALSGLVSGLGDQWSYYLNAEGYAAQKERRNNTYVGIGVTVEYSDPRGLLITQVSRGGPAEAAGLEPGEVITAADGVSLAGEARYTGTEHIRGEEGTEVVLTLLGLDGKERETAVRRGAVENQSLRYELLSDGTGYIDVDDFYSHSAGQFMDAVDDLLEQGAERLVFDMRDNGGGYVDELTQMLDRLLPEGPIFRSEDKGGREEVSQSDAICVELPMATLVNGNTYSAAEFFGAQLQESVGALIVGEPTSGKGYSQQAVPLPGGGALNLSTGRYTTGAGVSLVGTGVTLDAEVALGEEVVELLRAGVLPHEEDAQLQRAIEMLKEVER